MDRRQMLLKAVAEVARERRTSGLPLPAGAVELVGKIVKLAEGGLPEVERALGLLAAAQAETNRLLDKLAKLVGRPRRPLRIKRDDGSEAIIQEL